MHALEARLRSFWNQFLDRIDPGCAKSFAGAYEEFAARECDCPGRAVGETAPDFTLPDQDGTPTRLAEVLRAGPVVLLFFRGGWSPYGRLTLRAYAGAEPAFAEAGARLLALSPQRCERLARLAFEDGLPFPLLCDRGAEVAARYGIARAMPEALRPLYRRFGHPPEEENEDGSALLPLPATYVVDRDGRIRFAACGIRPYERACPERVLEAIDAPASTRSWRWASCGSTSSACCGN